MLGRILVTLCIIAIGLVGLYGMENGNVGLVVVALLGLALIYRLIRHAEPDTLGSEAQASYDALAQHRDPALEEARRQFLSEPTIHQVMPNLGGGQEL